MLKDFFINGCNLIAFLFVGGQLFKNRPLRLDSPLKRRIILGVICGLLGNILMLFSIQVTSTFIMDLRNLAVVMAAMIGGVVPSIIAGAMIAIGRVALFPISETSLVVAISFTIIGLGCGLISHLKLSRIMKWIATVAFSSISTSIVFIIVIPDSALLHSSLMYHWLTNIIFAVIVFYLLDYIKKSNELYRLYKENAKIGLFNGLEQRQAI